MPTFGSQYISHWKCIATGKDFYKELKIVVWCEIRLIQNKQFISLKQMNKQNHKDQNIFLSIFERILLKYV